MLISKIYKELIQFNRKKFLNRYFFLRRHTGDQQTHENMLNITNYQGNENQNHNGISPHTYQNGYYQKQNE